MKEVDPLPHYASRLAPLTRDIEMSMQTLVEELASPALNGAVLFVPDRWHKDEAGAIAVSHTPGLSDDRRDFTDTNIKQHRIDMTATTVGETFRSRQSQFNASRMNPTEHIVWGAYMSPGDNQSAVLQLAFDASESRPSEKTLHGAWDKYGTSVNDATEALITASLERSSLANDLLLDTPVTPNAYVVKWDVTRSTDMVDRNYPLFRNYLQELEQRINISVENIGGRVVAYSGDGQNIVITIPPEIDRANLTAVGEFGQRTAAPLLQAIMTAHEQTALPYKTLRPNIRIGLDLGHTEILETGEETGSIFWNIAKTIESLPRNRTSHKITDLAQLALWLAKQKK